jgi:thiol-disulfide isomerase/thioredoxin
MKKSIVTFLFICFLTTINAQKGYEVKINLKNCKDTLTYLTFYQFDKNMIVDTCKNIKNGKIIFNGNKNLDKGIYSLVGQGKSIYFDFIIDENTQKLEINSDAMSNYRSDLTCTTSKQTDDFFKYIQYFETQKNAFDDHLLKTKGMSKKDSTNYVAEKQKLINENISTYEKDFIQKNKGSFISDALNLKIEKYLIDIPKASNGRPDSVAVYNYYKKNYWKDVNFKDDGLVRTPFFANRIKRYFDSVITRQPDSTIVEIDRIMKQTVEGSVMYKLLLAHFTSTYETSKIMGFDKVFVDIVDKYFKTGKANSLYDDDNIVKNIINRSELLKPLLLGKTAPDLPMIPAESHAKIAAMGFDTAKTSEEVTKLYYKNSQEIEKTFLRLSDVKAKYTLLAFWDVDCGHCKIEIPKLLTLYHELNKEKIDVQVFCVYTLNDFEKYQKYIIENKLDWINVYDGVHINNLKEKYDIYSTPVIYVLDKNKVIKAKRIDVDQIKSIINALENEKKEKVK